MKRGRVLKTKLVYQNPKFRIFEDQILRIDGSQGKFWRLDKGVGVVVVPFDGKKVYLVTQFRFTFRKWTWELPAGGSDDKGLSPLRIAKKELKEETGILAKKLVYLGKFACGPGHTAHIGKVYLAEGLDFRKAQPEPVEFGMKMKGFTIDKIDEMIVAGKIIDSWTITPWYFFKDYLKRRKDRK